ncbi:alpha-galactosidase [Actinophytocola oryzae]|uniref:Alpha-galactosidase n=1 Tax=Actinophytocola oryzae TaxID=502181 RepID=A0A4R7W4V9_9PSEU|nr:alpha-galactosidase [Actinophytocola oryzae]TDV57770.1 alpha-galactosidase [Actinophytocola oryzae]
MIYRDEPSGAYLLTGDGFGYALAVGPDGSPRHLHWGGPLDPADLARLLDDAGAARVGSNTWSRPRAHTEELVTAGGARFDDHAVALAEAPFDPRLVGSEVDGDRLTIRLADGTLAVTLRYEVRGPALVRGLELHNAGDEPVTVTRAASATWPVPWQVGYHATTLGGGYAAETTLRRVPLGPGKLVLESRRGLPGHAFQPWLAIDDDAGEEHGDVWSVAVAHGGSWRIAAELSGDGHLHVTAGAGDAVLRLAPGERLTLPDTVGVYSPAGRAGLTHRWHDYERGHVLARPHEVRPVLYNSWESTFFAVDHDEQVALARQARELGVELFVVDDGWFTDRDDERGGLGDWRADPAKLPGGVAALADEVHALGMRFGLWVEPESVNPSTDLYRDHPDWVYRWPDREPTAIRHSHGLDFGNPAVRGWAFETLHALVRDGHVDYLKWDLNRSLTDAPATASHRHETGFREVVDRLRAANPDLWLETCASGGGRADLATLSRFEFAWPSDNTDAFERLGIQDGYAFVHSPQTMSCWVTDSPGYLSKRPVPLAFRCHVAMTGTLGIGGRLADWTEAELAEAGAHVARYKQIRETVQLGRRHRLRTDPDRTAVCHVARDGGQVAVFVFARTVRQSHLDPPIRLRGLDPGARYRDDATNTTYTGAFLTHHGLRPVLAGDYASALVVLSRLA